MRHGHIALSRPLRIAMIFGLSLTLLSIPMVQAGHLPTSPATFSITADPTVVDGVAILGQTARSSTGSSDIPVGVSGRATGSAGDGGRVVAVRGGVDGNASGTNSRVRGVFGAAIGNASGTNSRVQGVYGDAEGSATGSGARLEGVRGDAIATVGDASGVSGFADTTSGSGRAYGVQGAGASASGPAIGMLGSGSSASGPATGVWGGGTATTGEATGVSGDAQTTSGSGNAAGLVGSGRSAGGQGIGVYGVGHSAPGQAFGVMGSTNSPNGIGVAGMSSNGTGVVGSSDSSSGGFFISNSPVGGTAGVHGANVSSNGIGVLGQARATSGSTVGVRGESNSPDGIAVQGVANNGGRAGVFNGRVDITCNSPATGCLYVNSHRVGDLAEDLPSLGRVNAGDVVVLANSSSQGYGVALARRAYDTRVAGIVSAEPRIRLRVQQGKPTAPVAMVGIVKANATAANGSIEFGDLLTTSSVPGHLMRCSAPVRCAGAIVGKALEPLAKGQKGILVLLWRQ